MPIEGWHLLLNHLLYSNSVGSTGKYDCEDVLPPIGQQGEMVQLGVIVYAYIFVWIQRKLEKIMQVDPGKETEQ